MPSRANFFKKTPNQRSTDSICDSIYKVTQYDKRAKRASVLRRFILAGRTEKQCNENY